MSYPEHDKLRAIQHKSQAIGEFLEWCGEQGWELAQWAESGTDRMWPINKPIPSLLAQFFGIDEKKLEAEKLAMLEELRAQ